MARILDKWIATTYASAKRSRRLPSGRNALKSYIVEANASPVSENGALVNHFFSHEDIPVPVKLNATDDPSLNLVSVSVGSNEVEFYLDTLDSRYWIFHTIAAASAADSAIRALVHRTRLLDAAWMPSGQLETWSGELGVPRVVTAKFSMPTGLYQDELLDEEYQDESLYSSIGSTGDARTRLSKYRQSEALAPNLALWATRIARRDSSQDLVVVDDVTASGKLTCRGNSFRLHQELLLGLKARYADMIQRWESTYRLGWEPIGEGVKPTGETAELRLPESLNEDQEERLLQVLFNCGEPYRLYGVPIRNGDQRYIVRAVDLHTGDKIDFELLPDTLRAYLYPTTCGNVLARLLTNLQHYHDARVQLV